MRRKKRRKPMSLFAAGLIGIVVLVVFTYLGFTKFANPFSSQFTIHALVSNASSLRPQSLVRIAGVNVGKVSSISPVAGSQAANVTMTIQQNGLPIHSDATFWIRPRTFLEGNFFVDISPGSPSAPAVANGHTFPVQQSRAPVQLDQILSSLQANTRQNLQILLHEYGTGVKQGGPSFARSIQYWLPAYEYSSIVEHDLLGIQPHDLSNAIYEQGDVSNAFNTHPQNLQNLITGFNRTAAAFARENVALQNTIAELPRTLAAATPAFNALNAAFPPLEALARALIPGVRSTGPTIDVSLPFINQLRLLVQPAELRGLVNDLKPTVPALANLTNQTIPLMENQVRPASNCVAQVIYPWSNLQINDSNFNASNGFPPHPAYVEDLQLLPGLAGESRTFDGNGPYIRLLFGGGSFLYSLQPGVFGNLLEPLLGVQPVPPPNDAHPALQENVPCETQQPIANLDAPEGAPPTQISTGSGTTGILGLAENALNSSTKQVMGAELVQMLKSQGHNVHLASSSTTSSSGSGSSSSAKDSAPTATTGSKSKQSKK